MDIKTTTQKTVLFSADELAQAAGLDEPGEWAFADGAAQQAAVLVREES
jgi:hypothetical protein